MNNDICRCRASLCPIAETCKRYMVPGGEWTPYSDFSVTDGDCGFFIEIDKGEE